MAVCIRAGIPSKRNMGPYYLPHWTLDCHCGGIVGIVRWGFRAVHGEDLRMGEAKAVLESPWFSGPYGWPTIAAAPLPFVTWRGRQRFFDVPLDQLPDVIGGIIGGTGGGGSGGGSGGGLPGIPGLGSALGRSLQSGEPSATPSLSALYGGGS